MKPPRATRIARAQAFTLTELLVVIAVLAVLASLLMPALGRAKLAAQNAVCMSNLRQIGIALTLYVGEQDAYPLAAIAFNPAITPASAISPGWESLLIPYLDRDPLRSAISPGAPLPVRSDRGAGVWGCPAYLRLQSKPWQQSIRSGAYGYNRSGVSGPILSDPPCPDGEGVAPRNSQLGLGGEVVQRPVHEPRDIRPIKEGAVRSPSEMIAVGDALIGILHVPGGSEPYGSDNLSWGITHPGAVTPPDHPWTRRRHGGRWNVLSCDGHVVPMRTRALFGFRLDEVRARWNNDHEPHREFPIGVGFQSGGDPHDF
ncbi:MAG: DUF1559 domain-containing protein [Verrucomicrobiales bacterium]|nr:DUF1559 domain-containing protein [Verrucomicrobiales bacterium]